MKHHLEWKESTLNIRCWECSETLLSISTEGSAIRFNSVADSLEIGCQNCNTTCEYSLSEKNPTILNSQDWDSDVDNRDFEGETGEINRSLLRQYKLLLLNNESTSKFFEREFDIVGDFLEALSRAGIDGATKDNEIVDQYITRYKEYEYLAKSREQLFRRAINRFYKIMKSE